MEVLLRIWRGTQVQYAGFAAVKGRSFLLKENDATQISAV
jgi:hypothetical protein